MPTPFRYRRRVQFAETDLGGIVHFSRYFRFMEEAEHALWRAAGLTIERAGAETAWPRVSATFDYKHPLQFEDEFEVEVSVGATTRRTIRYDFTITIGDTLIGRGALTTVCVRKEGTRMQAIELPAGVVERLGSARRVD